VCGVTQGHRIRINVSSSSFPRYDINYGVTSSEQVGGLSTFILSPPTASHRMLSKFNTIKLLVQWAHACSLRISVAPHDAQTSQLRVHHSDGKQRGVESY
jgi:hypothetical protein